MVKMKQKSLQLSLITDHMSVGLNAIGRDS